MKNGLNSIWISSLLHRGTTSIADVLFDIQDGTADQIENCPNSVKVLDKTIWLRVSAASG